MCGIVGKVSLTSKEVTTSEINALNKKIAHRGPDDEGVFISKDAKVGLGSRRLAVIDLSSFGHQPMFYKNRYVIVFNGEIYNFQEEKRKLLRQGYKFNSKTDTEVILALYDKYGIKCLDHLRGFYAFAIYDQVKQTLFLARDRVGKKPLKYYFDGKTFCFASELKAIVAQKEVSSHPDFRAVNYYLTYGFVPAPFTGFENIYKLEPGHYLFLDINQKTLIKKRYWQLDFSHKEVLSEKEWIDKFLKIFEESVRLRMIADVPVGAFLSGGVDSSAVVAMMAKNSSKPIKTFTIGFKEKKYDETGYAQTVADLYHTDHTKFIVSPESIDLLPKLAYMYEEPYSDSSAVITYLVSKLARQHVTVILNGDGGDENFAGYDRYVRLKRDAYLENKKWLLGPIGRAISRPTANLTSLPPIKRVDKFFNKLQEEFASRFISYNRYFSEDEKKEIYSYQFSTLSQYEDAQLVMQKKFVEARTKDLRDQALYADLTNYLPEDLLVKVDIASMNVGLEARSPLVDQQILEFAASMPFELKVKGRNQTKYFLKKAVEGLVPHQNIYRKKMGFSIPLDEWFSGELNEYARSVLLSQRSKSRGLFDYSLIKDMLAKHSKTNDMGPKLWALLTLELWFEQYFD